MRLTGTLTPLAQETMRDMLDRQSAAYEAQLSPKVPWTAAKMTPQVLDRMMRMIVPFRFAVTGIDGTWKLGQNKPDAARQAAATQMATQGIGSEVAYVARLMRGLEHP